jgi:hypothetical protein
MESQHLKQGFFWHVQHTSSYLATTDFLNIFAAATLIVVLLKLFMATG